MIHTGDKQDRQEKETLKEIINRTDFRGGFSIIPASGKKSKG